MQNIILERPKNRIYKRKTNDAGVFYRSVDAKSEYYKIGMGPEPIEFVIGNLIVRNRKNGHGYTRHPKSNNTRKILDIHFL
jgi:hypothetical protein